MKGKLISSIFRPSYTGSIEEGPVNPSFLPSSIKDDPRYQEYDVCRCRYSFNCPSFGLKFVSGLRELIQKVYAASNYIYDPGKLLQG